MRINILTLFPEFFDTPLKTSMMHKAQRIKAVDFKFYNLRDFGIGPRYQVDDRPYGGGAGMILRVDVVDKAIEKIKKNDPKTKIILLTPKGQTFNQDLAQNLAIKNSLTLICGHYEGFDERIRDLVDAEISIGNFVLTGGEPATLVIIDAITRLIPGVLDHESAKEESFSLKIENSLQNCKLKIENCLEYPHYTRPVDFNRKKVPKILLSGNHVEVKKWRLQQAIEETEKRKNNPPKM
ncbi:MAG: tRNA (guanosine(37)-N1)-methyltransferase TrmD [Patescibacteria group bacterium]|nr:tRNA (guanosine(37)-N1)-methyltransferase TrmD [Patescibacteria group bacterium]